MRSVPGPRLLAAGLGVALLVAACAKTGSTAPGEELRTLRAIVPGTAGDGWDKTARALRQAMKEAKLVRDLEVSNVPGGSGTVGLTHLVDSRGRDDTFLVTGLDMVSGIVTSKSRTTLANATPVARLTSDYDVVVVAKTATDRNLAEFVRSWRANPTMSIGTGRSGGSESIVISMMATAAGISVPRSALVPYATPTEAIEAVAERHVVAAVGRYTDFAGQIDAGRLRALAISGPERMAEVGIPTLKEAGLNVSLENWRGVVAPPGVPEEGLRRLRETIQKVRASAQWQALLKENHWLDSYLAGEEFGIFLAAEQDRIKAALTDLGLAR